MKNIINLYFRQFHSSVTTSTPIVIGNIKDCYLPTNFSKREKIVTIFGCTGFLGENLVNELTKHRYQLILPFRGDVHDFKHIRMIGGVGQNLFMPFSIEDNNSIEKAIMHSDAVINLIGKHFENSHYSFHNLHVDTAANIARISKRLGINYFIQISALGVTDKPTPHLLPSGSNFILSKWFGEKEVFREFPSAVIIRPSNMWGYNDRFIYYYLHKKRRMSGKKIVIPLWKYGQETVKQPVYVGDVALAISKIILNDIFKGCVFEMVGPQRFQLDHLVQWFYLNMKHKLPDIVIEDISDWYLFRAKYRHLISASIPHFTAEDLELECISDQVTDGLTLEDLNINPCKLEDRLQWLLKPNHCMGYRWDNLGGFDPPPSPPLAIS